MCHRHTPSSKRKLSTKVFAKSAATCFCRLLKTSTPFIRGRLILGRPLFWFVRTSSRLFAVRWSPVCPFLRQSAPSSPAPLLLAPVPFCLLALSFLPVPACSGTCRLCLLPLPRLSPLVCRPMVTSLPFPAPVGPCQSLFATARCRYPRHHAKPPGPPSVSVRLAPPSSVLSGFRRLVSPRSRTCPSLHFPACPCSRSRTCAFLRQSAPSRPGPCAPGPFLRTRASENHRGE